MRKPRGGNDMTHKISKKAAGRYEGFLKKSFNNPKFKKVYDEERFLTSVMAMLYVARKNAKISQKQLSSNSNIPQPELSRIESGKQNITVLMLYRYLKGVGKQPHVEEKNNRHTIAF